MGNVLAFVFTLHFGAGLVVGAIIGAIAMAFIIRNNAAKALKLSTSLGEAQKKAENVISATSSAAKSVGDSLKK